MIAEATPSYVASKTYVLIRLTASGRYAHTTFKSKIEPLLEYWTAYYDINMNDQATQLASGRCSKIAVGAEPSFGALEAASKELESRHLINVVEAPYIRA